MANSKITVGNVELSHLYDLVADFPLTLDQLYPTVSAEAWQPCREATSPASSAGPPRAPRVRSPAPESGRPSS